MDALNRRSVLRGGAGVAVSGVGAAMLASTASASVPSPSVPGRRNLDERGWQELADAVSGPIFRQDTANYWALSLPTNHRYAQITPAGVFVPDSAQDVARSIRWAGHNQLPILPRCGGHSYAGFSSTAGLLVPLANMRRTRVDLAAKTLTVQSGCLNQEVYDALKDTDLLLPGGRCPAVGISGLVLGGGIGFATRAYGLTCDSLISTEIALADGRLVTADENTNPDLYWACRGGAGGNFGINTSYTFQLYRVPRATVWDFTWTRDDAPAVLMALSDLISMPEHARTLSAQFGIRNDGTTVTLYGQGLYFGTKTDLERILRPLLAATPPTRLFIEERKVWPAMSYFYETSSGDPYGTKSIVSSRPLNEGVINHMLDQIGSFRSRSTASRVAVSFFAMGGKDNAMAPGDTAYVHRRSRFILSMTAYWADIDSAGVRDANLGWLNKLYGDLSADLGTSAYQNFPDGELKNWWTAYYGSNYDRLVRVRQKYDPKLLFRYPQAVRANPGPTQARTS